MRGFQEDLSTKNKKFCKSNTTRRRAAAGVIPLSVARGSISLN